MGVGVGFVVHTLQAKAKEFEEFLLIASEIGELVETSRGDTFPCRSGGILNARLHFPIVEADATLLVEL